MTAVAIYARYSSDQQRDASIEDQIRLCEERAAREGWSIHNRYTDHGISGASLIRPGMQMLMQDGASGRFGLILCEALDRLSRDQEDIAHIYKRMRFAGVRIVTLAEGDVSDLHIGLKGTMNAIFLKDLADKTRRGLRGRVEAGRSGGGNSYGYDVVRTVATNGEPVRGERRINEAQAAIVRRIFDDYASGISPKAIAKALNRERVPGPRGSDWGASTIHGHRRRGTGILNNDLYVGKLVWNRLRYIKDPDSGKRVSRFNPESEWVTKEVPELHIIDEALWNRVKARQTKLEAKDAPSHGEPAFWDRRRPRYLFSGLLKCGECGGGFVKYSHERLGCTTARNKGTCTNMRTIRRPVLEETVLSGLRHRLMDPELVALFCEEYTMHRNRLRIERNAQLEADRAELGKIERDIKRLIQAIMDGVPGAQVKDEMAAKDARKTELEAKLAASSEEPVLLHPKMADIYRKQVAALVEALNIETRRNEAVQLIRGLVDEIVLTPDEADGLTIDLNGHLAAILSLATNAKRPLDVSGPSVREIKLVAGGGFEPPTFRL